MSQQQTESRASRRNWGRRTSVWVFSFTLVAGTAVLPAAGPSADSSSAPRFLSPSDEVLTSYRAFRRMHAKSEKFNQEGWLDAWTEMDVERLPLHHRQRARLGLRPQQGAEGRAPA